jgi:hypothetical protein
VSTLAAASLALLLFLAACAFFAIWSFHIPGPDVITGAKSTGPAGMPPPEPEPYNPLPWESNPKGPGALLAADRQYRTAQQDRRDYEASVRDRHAESLADWERRNAVLSARLIAADAAAGLLDTTVPQPRTEA